MNKALSLLQTDSIGSTQLNETTIMKESAKTENQIELLNECKGELNLEKILMLLEKNCSVNQLDETDGYALHQACLNKNVNSETIKLLIEFKSWSIFVGSLIKDCITLHLHQ